MSIIFRIRKIEFDIIQWEKGECSKCNNYATSNSCEVELDPLKKIIYIDGLELSEPAFNAISKLLDISFKTNN